MPTRPPARRVWTARLVTSPAAFLVAGAADVATMLARYLWARARGRPVH